MSVLYSLAAFCDGNRAGVLEFILFLPLLSGLAAFLIKKDLPRRALFLSVSAAHLLFSGCLLFSAARLPAAERLPVRRLIELPGLENAVFLFISSLLFCAAAVYAIKYLDLEKAGRRKDEEGFLFRNEPEPVFTGCLLLFLSAMTLVCVSGHMGLLWAGIEATTLFSAPLIYFHRSRRSLEATWKYLVICSVGIALALLGTFFLSLSGIKQGGGLYLEELYLNAPGLNLSWLKISFIFLFIGYGTKMGAAPMHTWLPDAHSEAPSVVSALLSGALLNCAFLGIWKVRGVCLKAGLEKFSGDIFVFFGLLSLVTAALFIISQKEYKRALAYSSIENMGIMLLALGLGNGLGEKLALVNALGHSLIKAGLFFIAGLILISYRSKNIHEVGLMAKKTPLTAFLWLAGFLLLMGTPPSPLFSAKFGIFRILLSGGSWLPAAVFLFSLILVFIGFSKIFVSMAFEEAGGAATGEKLPEHGGMLLPAAFLFFAAALAGLFFMK